MASIQPSIEQSTPEHEEAVTEEAAERWAAENRFAATNWRELYPAAANRNKNLHTLDDQGSDVMLWSHEPSDERYLGIYPPETVTPSIIAVLQFSGFVLQDIRIIESNEDPGHPPSLPELQRVNSALVSLCEAQRQLPPVSHKRGWIERAMAALARL